MSQKKDKQAKKNWYGMFKKAKGFDRNDPTLPSIVQQPIEFLLQHGKYFFYLKNTRGGFIRLLALISLIDSISPEYLIFGL